MNDPQSFPNRNEITTDSKTFDSNDIIIDIEELKTYQSSIDIKVERQIRVRSNCKHHLNRTKSQRKIQISEQMKF